MYFPKLNDLVITCVYSAEKRSQLLYVGRRNEQLCKRHTVLYKTCSFNMFITTKKSCTCITSSYYFYYAIISELKCHNKSFLFFLLSTYDRVEMKTFLFPIWRTPTQEIWQSNGSPFNINRKENFSYLTIPGFL